MTTKIYYFSATGNSLATAKQLADKLSGEVELISITTCVDRGSIKISADRVGFVFPVYAWGLPKIVVDFIETVSISSDYTFAIATNGGTPAGTLGQFRKKLRSKGVKLNAGFAVRHESGQLGFETRLIHFMRNIAGKKPDMWSDRLEEIVNTVNGNKNHRIEQSSLFSQFLGNIINPKAIEMFREGDKEFTVDKNCNGCATCEKVCPRGNLTMKDGRPSWNHKCEQCLACIHWCPRESIQIGDETKGQARYHHGEVSLKEIIS